MYIKRIILNVVILISIILSPIYSNKRQAYQEVEFGLLSFLNTNRNFFHKYWKQDWGAEGFFIIPFYQGVLQAGVQYNSYRNIYPTFVPFETIYIYFGWGKEFKINHKIRCIPAIHLGNVIMLFERPANRPDIPSYIYDMEQELGIRLQFEASYCLYKNLRYIMNFNYNIIYLNRKIELNFLSAGLSYTFTMPEWLRGFIR